MLFVKGLMSFMEKNALIKIEVAFATSKKQVVLPVELAQGTTASDAVIESKIAMHFPSLDIGSIIGVFGKKIPNPKEYIVKEGDRIEIYRPLIADPKEIRRKKLSHLKKKQ